MKFLKNFFLIFFVVILANITKAQSSKVSGTYTFAIDEFLLELVFFTDSNYHYSASGYGVHHVDHGNFKQKGETLTLNSSRPKGFVEASFELGWTEHTTASIDDDKVKILFRNRTNMPLKNLEFTSNGFDIGIIDSVAAHHSKLFYAESILVKDDIWVWIENIKWELHMELHEKSTNNLRIEFQNEGAMTKVRLEDEKYKVSGDRIYFEKDDDGVYVGSEYLKKQVTKILD